MLPPPPASILPSSLPWRESLRAVVEVAAAASMPSKTPSSAAAMAAASVVPQLRRSQYFDKMEELAEEFYENGTPHPLELRTELKEN